MNTFMDAAKAAEQAQSQGLLQSALTQWERSLQLAANADQRAFAAYQMGAFFWGELGDGVSARASFERTVVEWKKAVAANGGPLRRPISLLANAAENLMLLSLSYEEYERWAEELRREAPGEPILHEHVPSTREAVERGESWSQIMLAGGMGYIRPGEVGGGVHPSSGACIFHLLIENRKALRLSRQGWHTAVLGYVAAMTEVLDRADGMILKSTGQRQPGEMKVAYKKLLPFLSEYCAENPDDEPVLKTKEELERFLRESETAAAAQPPAGPIPSAAAPKAPLLPAPTPGMWFTAAVFLALGLWPFLSAAALGWKILGGLGIFIGGTGVLNLIVAHLQRRTKVGGSSWPRTATVENGIQKGKLKGLAFRLSGYQAGEGGYLYLNFKALRPVPGDRSRSAHMALRSIVALALPQVVKRIPSYRLSDFGASYTIGFGAGVTVPFYEIKTPAGTLSMLQVGSDVEDDVYQVYIHPSGGPVDLAFMAFLAKNGPAQTIQRQIGGVFLSMYGGKVLTL